MNFFKNKKGQALLIVSIAISLLVVTATVFAGHLTVLQLRQSANVQGSLISFGAANSGLECIDYWFNQLGPDKPGIESHCHNKKITYGPNNFSVVSIDLLFIDTDGDPATPAEPKRFLSFGSYRDIARGICIFFDINYRCF